MRATPIKNSFLKSIKENFTTDFKRLPQRIIETKQPADSFETSNVYQFATENNSLQVVIDKAKALITDTFLFNQNGKRIEEAHYEYNNKNQLISVLKKSNATNGKRNSVKTNIKYQQKHIAVFKNINFGLINIKTLFGHRNGKKNIDLTITKPQEDRVEQISFIEDEKLRATILKNNEIMYEGFGDAQTGELVFSKSTLNKLANLECCELLDNGNYHKQIYFDNYRTVVERDVTSNNADFFAKNYKDMITPHQELVNTLKPLLD